MSSGMEREHRIASYNKGCRCETCCEAKRQHGYEVRRRRRARTGPHPHHCSCGDSFPTYKGLRTHQGHLHGW